MSLNQRSAARRAAMKKVYNSARWQKIRRLMIQAAGGRCQWVEPDTQVRCRVMDRNFGGTESLTVDHTRDDVDPYDMRFLKVLCLRHHGKKDGAKRVDYRKAYVR